MRLAGALRNSAIDVVIATGGGVAFDGRMLPRWSERILVALPEGHPLATRAAIYWTKETILLSQYDPGRELEDILLASSFHQPTDQRSNVTTSAEGSSKLSSPLDSVSVP